jgi:hypothetical protein
LAEESIEQDSCHQVRGKSLAIGQTRCEDGREDYPKDKTGEHGVEKGPTDADNTAFVAQGQFATDQKADQLEGLNGSALLELVIRMHFCEGSLLPTQGDY